MSRNGVARERARVRAVALLVGGVVAVGVLSGCGGGEDPPTAKASSPSASSSASPDSVIASDGTTGQKQPGDSITAQDGDSGDVQARSRGRDAVEIDRAEDQGTDGYTFALDGRDRAPGAADLSADNPPAEGTVLADPAPNDAAALPDSGDGGSGQDSGGAVQEQPSPIEKPTTPPKPPVTDPPVTTPPVTEPTTPATPIAQSIQPEWGSVSVVIGTRVQTGIPTGAKGAALPSGTSFSATKDTPSWVSVGADGVLTLSPDELVPAGDVTVPVRVAYSDGSAETVEVPVAVTPAPTTADSVTPVYDAVIVQLGETVRVDPPKAADGSAMPLGTVFTKAPGAPAWVSVGLDGSLAVSPGTGVVPGSVIVPVLVTYADGSSETVDVAVTVRVEVTDADTRTPFYSPVSVEAGSSAQIAAPVDGDGAVMPTGSTFTLVTTDVPWASVQTDGAISLSPGTDVPAGPVKLDVRVTYPDGSIDTASVTVTVMAPVAAPSPDPVPVMP